MNVGKYACVPVKPVKPRKALLNQARVLRDLRAPPGNRLEALKGDRRGQYSIRVNDQWRICFRWREGGPADVEIVDYHCPGLAAEPDAGRNSDGGVPAASSSEPIGPRPALRVPPRRINEIVLGKRAITADTDLRLTRYFGLTPGFFLGLQADHDLLERRRQLGDDLERIVPRAA
jgi:plasmid maintenance system killer protein